MLDVGKQHVTQTNSCFFPAQILKQALVEDKTDGRGNSVSAGASRRARTSITPSSISPAILLTARWYMQICNPGRAKTPDLSLVTLLPLWAQLRCITVRKESLTDPQKEQTGRTRGLEAVDGSAWRLPCYAFCRCAFGKNF